MEWISVLFYLSNDACMLTTNIDNINTIAAILLLLLAATSSSSKDYLLPGTWYEVQCTGTGCRERHKVIFTGARDLEGGQTMCRATTS